MGSKLTRTELENMMLEALARIPLENLPGLREFIRPYMGERADVFDRFMDTYCAWRLHNPAPSSAVECTTHII